MNKIATRRPALEEFIIVDRHMAEHYPTSARMWFFEAPPSLLTQYVFPQGSGDYDETDILELGAQFLAKKLGRVPGE